MQRLDAVAEEEEEEDEEEEEEDWEYEYETESEDEVVDKEVERRRSLEEQQPARQDDDAKVRS